MLLQVILVMTLCGCANAVRHETSTGSSTEANPVTSYTFPKSMGPMTTTWQAAPGIDLSGKLPTLTRAYFESEFIASTYTKADAFPGFVRLVGDLQGAVIDGNAKTDADWTGTRRLRLQSITENAGIVRATVCDDRAGLYRQRFVGKPQEEVMPRGRFRYGAGDRPYMDEPFTTYVELRPVEGKPLWPANPALGEARAPNWDVFQGWELVRTGFADRWRAGTACDQWAHQNYPGFTDPGSPPHRLYPNGFPDPDFQRVLPQSPGWTQVGQP
ncbi:hypothetical protein ACPXCG_17970 [Gordonia sp. DT218]|uniref:hypothetical protein n=1 Tax=Gordonia sp. DT218 TaxID=3416659 RepID=UPI003CEBB65D